MPASTKVIRHRFVAVLLLLGLGATAGAFTFIKNTTTGLPIKWPPGTVPLRIMLGTTPTLSDGNTYNTSAQVAAQTWNNYLGNEQFTVQLTTGTPGNRNSVNELAFASTIYGQAFETNTLAVTTT